MGIGLVIFCLLILYFILKPSKGLDRSFLKNSIDSIAVVHNKKVEIITSATEIKAIINTLEKAEKIYNMDRENINRDFFDIILYSRDQTLQFRLNLNAYHGKVINVNDLFYRGDSLYKKIQYLPFK